MTNQWDELSKALASGVSRRKALWMFATAPVLISVPRSLEPIHRRRRSVPVMPPITRASATPVARQRAATVCRPRTSVVTASPWIVVASAPATALPPVPSW